MGTGGTRFTLSEVVEGLSYALDMTEGEPPGHAMRTCAIGMRIADEIELAPARRDNLYHALVLKDAGCSANSARMAALFGADDHVAKRSSKRIDWSRRMPAFAWALRTVAPGGSPRARGRRLLGIRAEGQVTRALMQARCDRGAEIAYDIGLAAETAEAIRGLDEHWDGQGQPRGLHGDQIPLLARILCLAQTVEIFHRERGFAAAGAVARRRSGRWFDPGLVDALDAIRSDRGFWRGVAAGEPPGWRPDELELPTDDERLDRIARAFARVVDAKSPWTHRHSERTGVIASSVASALGVDEEGITDLRRAALLHDIGKLAVSNRILDKPARLTPAELARVREHPLVTERILVRVPALAPLAEVAAAHHERLDGSGYPRRLRADDMTLPMRVLAVADVFEALTSHRPYRPAMSTPQALGVLRADAPQRLDGDAVAALERVVSRRPRGTRLRPAERVGERAGGRAGGRAGRRGR
jgi:HD-GYP domain-containing protein (c-di-GMP phosphodiesterase class II)